MNLTALKPKFVETLKKKLTHGNTRSILLNALPGRIATRLSLNDLEVIGKGLSSQFVKELTSKEKFKFHFTIQYNIQDEDRKMKLSRINKRLQNIKYEHDDQIKELGVESFGFGFPIIVRRRKSDITKFIASPLFIWKLNIYETFKKSGEWCIERTSDHDIRVNEVFASYLENEESTKINSLPDEMLEDGVLDQSEILDFIRKISTQLNYSTEHSINWTSFDKIPEKLSPTDYKDDTHIINSGVFGIFKSQKQSIIKETETLISSFNEIFSIKCDKIQWDNNHSPISTDPSQNGVLRSLNQNANVVIQGPPGTGKSQTLTAIIASALANNKKVLVVCEKRTALEVLETNLTELMPNLKNSICLVEDIVRDRASIVEVARNKADSSFLKQNTFHNIVNEDIKKFEGKAEEIDSQYQSLREPLNRNLKWADMVASWLDIEKNNRYDSVLRELSLIIKEINNENDLVEKVGTAAMLYAKVNDHLEPLSRLFRNKDVKSFHTRELVFLLEQNISITSELIPNIKSSVQNYSKCSDNNITQAINKIITQLEQVDKILRTATSYNINPNRVTLINKIKAIFSGSFKNIITDVKTIPEKLNDINEMHQKEFGAKVNLDEVHSKLTTIKDSVDQLRQTVVTADLKLKVEEVRKHSGFDYDAWHETVVKLKKSISELSDYFNIESKDIETVPINSLEHEVSTIKYMLSQALDLSTYYDEYFEWQRFVADCSVNELKIIDILANTPTSDWTLKIANAHLYNQMKKEDVPKRFPADNATLNILKDLGHSIQNNQKAIIGDNIKHWNTMANNKYKAAGIIINQLYNQRGSKGNKRNTLRKIIQTNFDAFTDFFPVLLMNPTTVTSILPLQRGLIDTVIFDEASQLRVEDTFSSMIRGKQIIVSGDSQQMPPSNYFAGESHLLDDDGDEIEDMDSIDSNEDMSEMAKVESLLEFAIENGFKETYLDMHYRSRHPDLIEFSNACFYKSRLLPMPEHRGYDLNNRPIRYKHVNGLNIKGTNPDECNEIIRLLKEDIDQELSVGIATFNIQQRNHILTCIGNEREQDTSFNKKMSVLDKNGFFVKNLENIQGDERDIIILSTTFGNKPDKKFTLGLGPISGSNGYRLLNVIITRAKHRLYVVTSIPESRIMEYRNRISAKSKVDGTSGLLGYLDYAKAVSSGDEQGKRAILDFIKTEVGINKEITISKGEHGMSESPFEEEVYNWLTEEVDKDRIIQQYPCGGFRLDMVIMPKSENGKKLVIECDGAAYHSSQLSWHHDLYRQKILEEQHGFVFHRIWSTNWWRNAKGEFRKLIDAINEFDKLN